MQIESQRSLTLFFCCIFLMLVLISGCNLLHQDSDNSKEFELEASIDGKNWRGSSTSELSDGELFINGIKLLGECDHEGIHMRLAAFKGEGIYPIFRNSYTHSIGCDVGSSYGNSPDTTGTVTITSYDGASGIIEGEFSFGLFANYDFDDVKDGEFFTVTGHFRSEMIDEN